MFKRKQSFTGKVVDRLRHFPADEARAKKAFTTFSLYHETKGKKEIVKILAFDNLAEETMTLQEGDNLTVSVSPTAVEGEFILQSFVEEKTNRIIRKQDVVSEESLANRNKELERRGEALVPVNINGRPQLVLKKLSDTIVISGKRHCKGEFIMDNLGVDYVNQVLRDKGLLGGSISVSKSMSENYKSVCNELLKRALKMGVMQ